jgi:redox-sensitive bicupin YhaK (pirin superfamily)
MNTIRKANERGHANHGWLDSYHTFSFADYHDPQHMGYRSLRVMNEDRVEGGQGFGTHPHRDHFLQIWLLPSRQGLPPSYAQQSFSDAPPSGLTLACSADGRAGSIKINQDVDLFIGRLDPKEEVSHPLRDERHAWVQLIEGDLDLNGSALSPGDGMSLDGEKELRLASKDGAHFLLFDLN